MKKDVCPSCKSSNIIFIVYGDLSAKGIEACQNGEIKWGGCEFQEQLLPPLWHCKNCKHEWSTYTLRPEHIALVLIEFSESETSSVKNKRGFQIFYNGSIKKYSLSEGDKRFIIENTIIKSHNHVMKFYEELHEQLFERREECKKGDFDKDNYTLSVYYGEETIKTYEGSFQCVNRINNIISNFIASLNG